jgi:hypothetical protein
MARKHLSPRPHERRDVRVRDLVRLQVTRLVNADRQAALDRITLERLSAGQQTPLIHLMPAAEGEATGMVDLPNSQIMNRLLAIEAKVDALLAFLSEREMEQKLGPLQPINLSAGGIMFSYPEPLAPGTLVRLELVLQAQPVRPMIVAAEVLRVIEPESEWGAVLPVVIAAKFIDLDPADADRLAKRVFDVQRIFLRRSRLEEQETTTADNPIASDQGTAK